MKRYGWLVGAGLGLVGCWGLWEVLEQGSEGSEEASPASEPTNSSGALDGGRFKEHVHPQDGSRLVWIPGGEFTMGRDAGDGDEKPAHKVTVEGFWLGKYEVTNKQYAAFLKAKNGRDPMFWDTEGYDDPEQPVVGITWQEVKEYVDWAGLRLPTEAEWEYAAAAGKQLRFPTATGEMSHDLANYRGKEGRDRWEGPAPVGSFPPNPFGLYDLAGNAWEWTSSFYESYPYVESDGREDTDRSRGLRVMRGGPWHYSADYLSTTHRHRFASHLRYDYAGFRVALGVEGKEKGAEDDESETTSSPETGETAEE